jgi:hypothetical protein
MWWLTPASINSMLILFFICTICRTSSLRYRSVRRRSRIALEAKRRLHKAGYFRELLARNSDMPEGQPIRNRTKATGMPQTLVNAGGPARIRT